MDTYSVKEIAGMLNTNPVNVRRWIRSGRLEAIQESRKGKCSYKSNVGCFS